MSYIESKLNEFEIEDLKKLEGRRPNYLDYAHQIYETLLDSNSSMNALEFLDYFNELTEDEACILPRNYPLMVPEFQIKYMKDTQLNKRYIQDFKPEDKVWEDQISAKRELKWEQQNNFYREISEFEDLFFSSAQS